MKRKSSLITLLFLSIITGSALFYSCEKAEETTPSQTLEGVSVKNGSLNFESVDAFFAVSEKLGSMSEAERDNWEQSIGFTSMRSEINTIIESTLEDENADPSKLVAENKDILVLNDEGTIDSKIKSQAFAAIVNREGVFYVDGTINLVRGGKIATAEDGTIESAELALEGKLKSDNKNVIEFISDSPELKSGCGSLMTAWTESSDRKCDYRMRTYIYPCFGCCGNFYLQVRAERRVVNYKKNWLGKWKEYNTAVSLKNGACTIEVPIVSGYNGKSSVFYYKTKTYYLPNRNTGDCTKYTEWINVGDRVQNTSIKSPTFIRVKGEASNRGVGDRWAKINCGAW